MYDVIVAWDICSLFMIFLLPYNRDKMSSASVEGVKLFSGGIVLCRSPRCVLNEKGKLLIESNSALSKNSEELYFDRSLLAE